MNAPIDIDTASRLLDRPVWTALTTRHPRFSEGVGLALRFKPDVSPFAACRADDPESLDALAELVGGDGALLLQAGPIAVPDGLSVVSCALGVQMLLTRPIDRPARDGAVRLKGADAPEMLALATLTRPGPFLERTHLLGDFWGVKRGGRLVAMAGERLKQPGFTEVSGVCVHPEHRGRGYARLLSAIVAAEIQARRETAYLHAYAHNHGAIALYESLGFRIRRNVDIAFLERAES